MAIKALLAVVPPVILNSQRSAREYLVGPAMSSPLTSSVTSRFAASNSIGMMSCYPNGEGTKMTPPERRPGRRDGI